MSAISRFPVPAPDDLPADIREVIEINAKKLGFVPNVFWAYAWKPDHFRAFFQFYDSLMKGPSGLTRAEREMIVLDGERHQRLHVLHGVARRRPPRAGQAPAPRGPGLGQLPDGGDHATPARHAGLRGQDTRESAAIDTAELARLREHGFSDSDIWDIGAVAAFFNLSNRMANLADMRPNAELYAMGRDLPVPAAAPPAGALSVLSCRR